jgi:hypothetical protein
MHILVVEALLIAIFLSEGRANTYRHRKYDRRTVLPIPPHLAGPASEDFQLIGQWPEYDECRALLQRLEGNDSQFVPALNQNESDKEDRARSGIDISGPVMYVFTYCHGRSHTW